MTTIIADGDGGGSKAAVTNKRLDVSSRANPRIFYASRDNGLAFIWAGSVTVNDGEIAFYLQNIDQARFLVMNRITIGSSVDGEVNFNQVIGTASGSSSIDGAGLNLQLDKKANANVILGAITGTQNTKDFGSYSRKTDSLNSIDFLEAVLLGSQNEIAIRNTSGVSATFKISIMGDFEGTK